jgi:ribonuclease D
MIQTEKELKALMLRAKEVDAVGLDTEFVWERTYYPRLGLIQLALSSEECFLIDPLTIDDLSPLGELLADHNVVKIFHDGPGDLAILRKATGADPCNIFDTRLAAGFAGFPSILSLLVLVENLLAVTLNKSQTRTNWLKRPLTANQIKYGLEDVRHLRKVRRLLLDRVQSKTLEWLKEESIRFDSPETYLGLNDDLRYTKVNGARRLNRTGLALLQALAAWREETARRRNKPRGHIIKDEVLIFMAEKQLVDFRQLHECEGISAKSIGTYGKELAELCAVVLTRPEDSYPELLRNPRLNKGEVSALAKLQKSIAKKGEEFGLDPALLGNKAELTQLIQQRAVSSRQQEGWRKIFLQDLY